MTYGVHGSLNQDTLGFLVEPEIRQEVDTFIVVRTPFGWRIASPVLDDPHLLPNAALKTLRFPRPRDRAVLDSLGKSLRKAGA